MILWELESWEALQSVILEPTHIPEAQIQPGWSFSLMREGKDLQNGFHHTQLCLHQSPRSILGRMESRAPDSTISLIPMSLSLTFKENLAKSNY